MIAKITTHIADALDKLAEEFKNKPKLAGYVTSFVQQAQEIEDALYTLLTDRGIDTAIGAQLDGIGSIVGEARMGRSDTLYRNAIKARIGINIGTATPESILHILFLYDGDAYMVTEYFPASFEAERMSALSSDPQKYLELLQAIAGVGIKVYFQYALYSADKVFTFADSDDEEDSVDMGFADDAETIGGFFADVVS